ncbi:MAG: hypothetical protein HQK51_16865 [Oligoflexia bacterium]|nr:hypothetical protein [Oligoflexia bacterium]
MSKAKKILFLSLPFSLFLSLFLSQTLFLSGCKSSSSSANTPASSPASTDCIEYSTTTCSNCIALKNQLIEAKISYTEKYTDNSTSNYNEMMSKVRSASWYTTGMAITMPIVDVKGHILQNPTLAEIQSYLDINEAEQIKQIKQIQNNYSHNICIMYLQIPINECSDCLKLKKQLEISNIFCTEKYPNDNEKDYIEVATKLKNVDWYMQGSILTSPIVEINNHLLLDPTFDMIKSLSLLL